MQHGRGYMAQALARRYKRAIQGLLNEQYSVMPLRPGLFQVRKANGEAYKVRMDLLPVCTCADWAKHGHGHVCKHVLMVGMATAEVAYVGYRAKKPPHARVFVVRDGRPQPLRHVVRHSPTGFEWGYGGSGPADLALSILADYLGDEEIAEDLKGPFKSEVVSRLPHAGWVLTENALQAFLQRHLSIPVEIPLPSYA